MNNCKLDFMKYLSSNKSLNFPVMKTYQCNVYQNKNKLTSRDQLITLNEETGELTDP